MILHKAEKGKYRRFAAALLAAVCAVTAIPSVSAAAADKPMTLQTARSLALASSSAYESAEMSVDSKKAARDSALKSIKLKKKNLSTFRWSPLLSFKFPTKPNFAQASEFQFKPVKLASEILPSSPSLSCRVIWSPQLGFTPSRQKSGESIGVLWVGFMLCSLRISL